jgi:hypothetical protein
MVMDHARQTALDAIGLISGAGAVKYTDEVGAMMKGAVKGADEAAEAAVVWARRSN